MSKVSSTLQYVAAEAARTGRNVNQFVLEESPIKVVCIGYKDALQRLVFLFQKTK